MSNSLIAKFEKECKLGAGNEPVKVEYIKGTLYAYGSELACLRLFRYYRGTPNVRCNYSENLKTWHFSLEMKFQ